MVKKSNLVKSVIKALDIIEILNKENEMGISEISQKLGMDHSTVYRLVSTLKYKGYVKQNTKTKRYSNSFKLFELGNNVVERLGLRREAQPFLEELAENTHETVNLAVMDGKHVLYIDKIESTETIKVDLNIGKRLPSYCTGLGKVMLAYMPESKVKQLLKDEEFIKYTNHTITSIKELIEQLKEIRKQGYGIDNEEYVKGLVCLAAPVRISGGKVVAAISIAVPKYRYLGGETQPKYAALLKKAADSLSKKLGYNA